MQAYSPEKKIKTQSYKYDYNPVKRPTTNVSPQKKENLFGEVKEDENSIFKSKKPNESPVKKQPVGTRVH